MQSGGHRSATVVIVFTMIFVPVFKNNHWVNSLFGKSQSTSIAKCKAGKVCPEKKTVVKNVYLPTAKRARAYCTKSRSCVVVRVPIAKNVK